MPYALCNLSAVVRRVLPFLAVALVATSSAKAQVATETIGAKLRRLYAVAQWNNPLSNIPLRVQPHWEQRIGFAAGQVVSNGGNVYLALSNGQSGNFGGPTGNGLGRILDGSLSWSYLGPAPTSESDPFAPELTIAVTPAAGLTAYIPAVTGGTTQNSAAFQFGSDGTAQAPNAFLASSEGPKINVPITRISGSGSTVSVTTSSPHNYSTGSQIVASGLSPAGFNAVGGTQIAVTGPNAYTYPSSGPVSGSPMQNGTVSLWGFGNTGLHQDWFGSGFFQGENNGQWTFLTDANLISIWMPSMNGRLAVDDRYYDLGIAPNLGYLNYYTLDFSKAGSKKLRKIRVEGAIPTQLGIYVAPGDRVQAPSSNDVIKAQFVGDSFFNANGISTLTIADLVGLRLGWANAIPSNNGGSGFVAAIPGLSLSYLDRIQDVKAIAPDVLVYVTSGNDSAKAYTSILANAVSCLKQARAWFPNMPIFVIELQSWSEVTGSIAVSGSTVTVTVPTGHTLSTGDYVTVANVVPAGYNGTYRVTVTGPTTFTYRVLSTLAPSASKLFFVSKPAAAVRNAVTQIHDPLTWLVPTISDPVGSWFTGSGNVANPKGDGNADLYVSPDGIHPEFRGVDYLAQRIAGAIANVLPKVPITSATPATSVSLSAASTVVTTGSSVTIKATVSGSKPSGTVQFLDGTSSVGNPVTIVNGTVSYTGLLGLGSHPITALYAGDAANSASGSSPLNVMVIASPIPQSISMAPIGSQVLVSLPASLTVPAPAASSGLPVILTSLTNSVCTVTGLSITLASSGLCTLQASQPGDSIYAPASPVSQSFAVSATTSTGPDGEVPLPAWTHVVLFLLLLGGVTRARRTR